MAIPPLNPLNRMAMALNPKTAPKKKTQSYSDKAAQACAMGKAKA